MATLRQFSVGLYREHLEESSFLYAQRLARVRDPEVRWPDLRDLEERLDAHIDALVIGGELAAQICRAPGDPGETHAALSVFCREDLKTDAFALLNELDPADEPAVGAASSALRSEAGAGWRDDLLRCLQPNKPNLVPVLAQVAGFRRYPCEELLARTLSASPVFGTADLAWALGRVGTRRSVPLLFSLLESADARICEAATIALLRLGEDAALERSIALAPTQAWARRVLAIAGDSRAVNVLLEQLENAPADEDTVIGLGLLGHLSAVAPLLRLLEDDGLWAQAAVALNTITGANLYTEHFVPDTFDPDELLDEERQAFDKDGTLPTRNGEPYGNWVRGPLRDPVRWREWLEQNKHRFSRDRPWRMGEPYGPSALLRSLRSPAAPYAVRAATCNELVARFGLDVPFEVELRVPQQMTFLGRIETWISAQSNRFEPGRWYFAGRPQG
jgi:uncharacterized protein (TIGR02270 family)